MTGKRKGANGNPRDSVDCIQEWGGFDMNKKCYIISQVSLYCIIMEREEYRN